MVPLLLLSLTRTTLPRQLPELNKDVPLLEKLCEKYDLQPRGSAGEHSAAVGGKWDISNKQRIGFTEVELVQKMIDGIVELIAAEERLAAAAAPRPVPQWKSVREPDDEVAMLATRDASLVLREGDGAGLAFS